MTTIHSKIRAVIVAALLVSVAAMTSGCLWAPDLAHIKREIQRQIPGARFEKEIELSLGPVSLGFARLFTRMAPDAREASSYLRDVSKIQLAVYNADSMPPSFEVSMPDRLKKMQSSDGWEMAVKIRDGDELVWVLYRIDDETIKELYVVVLNDKELVMVRAEGRLEKLVARALRDAEGVPGLPKVANSTL